MNEYIQNLEAILALEPTNLNIRKELLEAYQSYGVLSLSDLRDLAALDDTGAIEIIGKQPSLESRSKNFYLRCAWIVVQKAQSYLISEIRQETKHRSGVDVTNYLEKTYVSAAEAIAGFSQLFRNYLNREIVGTVPYKGFREDVGTVPYKGFREEVTLTDFTHIFNELHRDFTNIVNRIDVYHGIYRQRLEFEQLENLQTAELIYATAHLLDAYHCLALALRKNPKGNTDKAIYASAISINYATGQNYYNNQELQQSYRTASGFYKTFAKELLEQNRPDIIKDLLPRYTPE